MSNFCLTIAISYATLPRRSFLIFCPLCCWPHVDVKAPSQQGEKTVSKILRNAWIALAVLPLVTMVTACGGSQGSSSSSGNVAAVIKGLDNPFFQAMQQGIQQRAKTLGINVSVQAATS